MKRIRSTLAACAILACTGSNATAADLLDVKPVVTESTLSVEISADIPMTYTYYNISGQPRAVVDIAEADPEKVEPLIVVNKGLISSISVDKAQISGMVVSRIIFNLISQSEIAVSANADRKMLTVTFPAALKTTQSPQAELKQAAETMLSAEQPAPIEQKIVGAVDKPVDTVPTAANDINTADPLGLDQTSLPPAAESGSAAVKAAAAAPPAPAASAPPRKLEPVVPVSSQTAPFSINKITPGDNHIDIETSAAVDNYKIIKLSHPERIAIDIPSAKSSLETKSILINKFGITKARIGVTPGHVRIVLDSAKADFPKHTITRSKSGLRINFN